MDPTKTSFEALIIDTSLSWRNVIVQTLRNKFPGLVIREAGNAEQALLMAVNPPDLIIAELRMPGMTGSDLLRNLRSLKTTRNMPVLIMGEQMDSATVIRLVQMGVDGILIKPFDVETVVARVEAALRRVGAGPVQSRPRNAVRRRINETVYFLMPAKVLTPSDICFAAPGAFAQGAEVECDFTEVNHMLGLAHADATVTCLLKSRETIAGMDLIRLSPQGMIEGLEEAIEGQFTRHRAKTTFLALGALTPMIGIPARSIDLCALGMKVASPLEFEAGKQVSVSVRRLLRHVFSRCRNPQILCQIVRCSPAGDLFEMGMRFKEAPPDFVGDVLHWSAVE